MTEMWPFSKKKIKANSIKKNSWAVIFRLKTTQQKPAVLHEFVYSHDFFQDIQDISNEMLSLLQKN